MTAPWFQQRPTLLPKASQIAIIGAGLAGSALSYQLSRFFANITVFDQNPAASGASGNLAGLLKPVRSKAPTPLSTLTLLGVAETTQWLAQLDQAVTKGIFELKKGAKSHQITSFSEKFLTENAFFHENGLVVSPPAFCQAMLSASQATVKTGYTLKKLQRTAQNDWLLDFGHLGQFGPFSAVFFAQGANPFPLPHSDCFGLTPSRGQLLMIPESCFSPPNHAITFGDYLLPPIAGKMVLGATYDHHTANAEPTLNDRQLLIDRLLTQFPDLPTDWTNHSGLVDRVAFRNTTSDYLPMVGPVPDFQFYLDHYADLQRGRPAEVYPPAIYTPNLWLLNGLGSRGLTFAPLLAKWLAEELAGYPLDADRQKWLELLHPARFLIRKLKKGQ